MIQNFSRKKRFRKKKNESLCNMHNLGMLSVKWVYLQCIIVQPNDSNDCSDRILFGSWSLETIKSHRNVVYHYNDI